MRKKSSSAVIVAAGNGSRMKSTQKKQYMELAGKPVLYYSLKAMEESTVGEIILVVSEEDIPYCQELVRQFQIAKVTAIVSGGANRYDSVMEGLKQTQGELCLIHDGARPMITVNKIEELLDALEESELWDGAILAVPVKDTIKVCKGHEIIDSPNRETLYAAQTPQGFISEKLKKAYDNLFKDDQTAFKITDDAMVIQHYGNGKVCVVEGDYRNIKITTPEDLQIAKTYFE